MDQRQLLDTTLRFEYANETYRIEILSKTEIRWTREVGDPIGQGDTERYVYSRLSENLVMLTWIEADGLGLSNVLDFSEKTVITHANMGRDVFENPGKLICS